MGGIGKTLFGSGGDSASLSANHAWDMIKNQVNPAVGYLTSGGNAIASLLGVPGGSSGGGGGGKAGARNGGSLAGGGTTNQMSALDNFANSGGMQFLREQGNKQITSNQAAKGLLNSGSTLTSLTKYGQGLGSTYLNQYMSNLFDFARLGLGAGGLLTSAGAYSKGESDGPKGGILPTLVSAGSMIPGVSDIRLKTDIVYTGEKTKHGLKIYEYTLFGQRQRGVMAHEVKEKLPHAYLPNHFGKYDGVDYRKIGKL